MSGTRLIEIREEVGKQCDHVLHTHTVVEVRALRQVGNQRVGGFAPGGTADGDLSAVRDQQPGDQLEQRGFSASVGTKQTDNLSSGQIDVEILKDRLSRTVALT